MNYTVIHNIPVLRANAVSSYFTIGAPSMIGLSGMVHNLDRNLNDVDNPILRFGVVVHELEMHGLFAPHLHKELKTGNSGMQKTLSYAQEKIDINFKAKMPCPVKPHVTMDMVISIVLETEDEIDQDEVQEFFVKNRIIGGVVDPSEKSLFITQDDNLKDAISNIRSGKVIAYASKDDTDPLSIYASMLRLKIKNDYFLTSTGYHSLYTSENNNQKFAYVEPMVSMCEYISVYLIKSSKACENNPLKFPLWKYSSNKDTGEYKVIGDHTLPKPCLTQYANDALTETLDSMKEKEVKME